MSVYNYNSTTKELSLVSLVENDPGGGGNARFESVDYVHFDGTVRIALPFAVMADYMITVDFQPDQYSNYMIITGNTVGNFINHITMYANQYYLGAGASNKEIHFSGTFDERHVIEFNKNAKIYFDDVEKGDYYPTDISNCFLTLGYRQDQGALYKGKFYGYKITSISTDSVLCNLVPKHFTATVGDYNANLYGLYDTVNDVFYCSTGITGGNDEV